MTDVKTDDKGKLGSEEDSTQYWADKADDYTSKLEGDYHSHRLGVIRALIPDELYSEGKNIYDFGCGDAVHFPEFLEAGASIQGADIAPEMIDYAEKKLSSLGYDPREESRGGDF